MERNKQKIGFIGQGWIGKNMADDFEERGYTTVRYSLEPEYADNKDKIKDCDITFIAVPTPTTETGFSLDYVRSALENIGDGNIAVIKSTILPGSTQQLQFEFPNIVVMHSPEFLREKSAAEDTRHPSRNILGILPGTPGELSSVVMQVLPRASYNRVVTAESAECIKYIGNNFLYTKIVFFNMMYDLVGKAGGNWDEVRESVVEDTRIGASHTNIDESGRGAGGHCFIKDFEAMIGFAEDRLDSSELEVLYALRAENNTLLVNSGKDIDLLIAVYGRQIG